MYFDQRQDSNLTMELSEKGQYSRNPASNQKQLKWNNTAYVNKWSFTFKIELLCLSGNQDLTLYEGDSNS